MKTRIISLAALLLFAASATSAFADAWIGSAVNVNGTWYSTKTLGWGRVNLHYSTAKTLAKSILSLLVACRWYIQNLVTHNQKP